jgi:hypothetical protein
MADMALAAWENGYAFDSHGPHREAQRLVTAALAAQPAAQEPSDDSILLCVSDLQRSVIFDNSREMKECVRAVVERLKDLAAAQPPSAQEPSKDTPAWMQGMAHNIAVEYMREGQQREDMERDIVNAMKEAAREVALAFAGNPKIDPGRPASEGGYPYG